MVNRVDCSLLGPRVCWFSAYESRRRDPRWRKVTRKEFPVEGHVVDLDELAGGGGLEQPSDRSLSYIPILPQSLFVLASLSA